MKTLKQLCEPRDSVFDPSKRDTVLNLAHLVDNHIPHEDFFTENYITEGMKTLLTEAFRRLQGQTEQAVFKLTQAMGGGKTHNLIALGLLARHPDLRKRVMRDFYDPGDLGVVRVVAFSGRETDVPNGIWGEIAKQLGKEVDLKDYYAPLKAPGQKAWQNLLKGQPTLILLDELPPYLDNARATTVGNSDLSKVTATALANLFEAVAQQELRNVCVVLTDLVGVYADASAQIQAVLQQLQDEAQRHAMNLTPVRINTDEFYHILRKRLFRELPADRQIEGVVQAYAKAIRDARQMDITSQSPEQFAQLIQSSYPFHPAIKDLYARFRENPGFQQTRALIRLMRIVTAQLWESGGADQQHLICAHDIDLNDPETLSEIRQINPNLENAIAHDIAAQGRAVAEIMDDNLGGSDTRDACRLIFIASLANVPNAVLGLSIPEIVAYLCAPGRNLARLKGDVLEKLSTAAWYLHSNRDGKLFFKNVENLIAKLEGLAKTYVREQSLKELRERLEELFSPKTNWCYQKILALPAPDEIELNQEIVTLIVSEPYVGHGLNPQLRNFYDQTTFKNRVAILTGARNTFETLMGSAKRLKAIRHILSEMETQKIPTNDPQYKQADELHDRILAQFLSGVRETFSTLYYPTRDGLHPADFLMKFENNRYDGEAQILEVLRARKKFEDDVTGEIFRKKVEARLFTTQVMLWSEIRKRGAMNPLWQWHRRDALDALKDGCVHQDIWREDGSYVDRGPFPQPSTSVQIRELSRDDETGRVKLKVMPVHGDTVYAEVGGEATPTSQLVEQGDYETDEMEVSFLAVDSTGVHDTGTSQTWRNRLTLKYRFFTRDKSKMLELRAIPNSNEQVKIRYTTDGSDPKVGGGLYDGPVSIPHGTQIVLALAERDAIQSEQLQIPISWDRDQELKVDPERPAIWMRPHRFVVTRESYEFIERLRRYGVLASGVRLAVTGERWAELSLHEEIALSGDQVYEAVEAVRKLLPDGQVSAEATRLRFERGQHLLDWVAEVRTELSAGEVKQ